jgi:hypothetical protein
MAKRHLRIVKRAPTLMIGVCEACNGQFKSQLPQDNKAEWEISTLFDRHKCKPIDSSQNALRIVRESTEGK